MLQRQAVYHRPQSEYAYAVDEHTLTIRLRAAKGNLNSCVLFYGDRAEDGATPSFSSIPMQLLAADNLFDWYEVTLHNIYPRIMYYFELRAGEEQAYYYADHFYDALAGLRIEGAWFDNRCEYYQYPYIRREDLFTTPAWFKDAVVYNIFPDSFANRKHGLTPSTQAIADENGVVSRSRLGGTISGVMENLDYIQDMGFNTVYLNPFFHAESYHKYDTVDYFHVDPCMGVDADFVALTSEAHRRGMRVIIDGVFNHCGANFFAFRDVLEKQEASRYKDWFYGIHRFPVKRPDPSDLPAYDCFAYVESMPKMNTGCSAVIEYFCKVGKHWITEFGIDGWRLDVANEVDHQFWRAFHAAVTSVKSDVVLIAEAWEEARSFITPHQFHSAMNYDFRRCMRDFIATEAIDASGANDSLTWLLTRYEEPALRAQLNLLDSHDVPRFLSLCGGDVDKLKQAVVMLMLFPGVPCLFYGDEKGMAGVQENEYRRPMAWEQEAPDIASFVKAAIALRQYPEVKQGKWKVLRADKGSRALGFALEGDAHRLVCWLNAPDQTKAGGEILLAAQDVCVLRQHK